MSQLPATWAATKIGDVFTILGGGTPSTSVESNWNGDIPWISSADISDRGRIAFRKAISRDGLNRSAANLVPKGSVIVVTRVGLGKVATAPCDMAFSQDCQALLPIQGIEPEFLRLQLSRTALSLRSVSRGTTISGVTKKQLLALPFIVPPTAEQARITAAIEEQFSQLDAGIAALERLRHDLKRMRAAVLNAAVPSPEESMTPKVRLDGLVTPDRKIAYGVLVPGDHDPNGVPFVRVGDLGNRQVSAQGLKQIAPAIAARYPRTRLQGGEVLLSLVGTIGRTAVVPPELAGANAARALAVIPVQEAVEPRYVAIALSRDRVTLELTDLAHEVARKTLNLEDVRRYEIPLPTHAEQLEIVKAVETEETRLTSVEEVVTRTFRRAEHLRSSILGVAFSGRLVSQDENDEPASALLARIASEQAPVNSHRIRRNRKTSVPLQEVTA